MNCRLIGLILTGADESVQQIESTFLIIVQKYLASLTPPNAALTHVLSAAGFRPHFIKDCGRGVCGSSSPWPTDRLGNLRSASKHRELWYKEEIMSLSMSISDAGSSFPPFMAAATLSTSYSTVSVGLQMAGQFLLRSQTNFVGSSSSSSELAGIHAALDGSSRVSINSLANNSQLSDEQAILNWIDRSWPHLSDMSLLFVLDLYCCCLQRLVKAWWAISICGGSRGAEDFDNNNNFDESLYGSSRSHTSHTSHTSHHRSNNDSSRRGGGDVARESTATDISTSHFRHQQCRDLLARNKHIITACRGGLHRILVRTASSSEEGGGTSYNDYGVSATVGERGHQRKRAEMASAIDSDNDSESVQLTHQSAGTPRYYTPSGDDVMSMHGFVPKAIPCGRGLIIPSMNLKMSQRHMDRDYAVAWHLDRASQALLTATLDIRDTLAHDGSENSHNIGGSSSRSGLALGHDGRTVERHICNIQKLGDTTFWMFQRASYCRALLRSVDYIQQCIVSQEVEASSMGYSNAIRDSENGGQGTADDYASFLISDEFNSRSGCDEIAYVSARTVGQKEKIRHLQTDLRGTAAATVHKVGEETAVLSAAVLEWCDWSTAAAVEAIMFSAADIALPSVRPSPSSASSIGTTKSMGNKGRNNLGVRSWFTDKLLLRCTLTIILSCSAVLAL